MKLIEVSRRSRFGHEFPKALIKRRIHQEIGGGAGTALVVDRRPFAEDSRRIEINVNR